MKKSILFAAALLAFAGCKEEKPIEPQENKDSIELSAESATFEQDGGTASLMVTSSGAWTLKAEEEYDWVSASAKDGEDGDVVKFTVKENFDKDKTANFVFEVGKATAKYTVFSYAGEKPAVKLVSPAEVEISYEGAPLEIKATSPLNYRDLKCTLSQGAEEWLEYKATLSGDTDNDARINYSVKPLEGLENRTAEITVAGEGLVPAVVKVTQLAKLVLATESQFYKAELKGGDITVPMIANVEYDIKISEDGNGWLTHSKKDGANEIFTVAAMESGSRSAKVTFTQKNVAEGKEPLVAEISISQVNTLIEWAAEMTTNRLFPKWEGDQPAGSYSQFTLETLFYADNFNRPAGGIFTLMGIEGQFLLRFGDIGNPVDHLQLALSGYNENIQVKFEPKVWYHIALTFNSGEINIYIDGKLVHACTYRNSVNLFPDWSYEPSGNRTFWYGYSYDSNRDFRGMMTEMRAWNRALTKEEINAPDHFYTVPTDSEGLMTYWRFDEGEGATVANKSTSAAALKNNALHGELNVSNHGRDNYGEAGIKWVPVALPVK